MNIKHLKINNLSSFIGFTNPKFFGKKNLIFGTNGSGKSTIVDLLRAIDQGRTDQGVLRSYLREHASKEATTSRVSISLGSEDEVVSVEYDTKTDQITCSGIEKARFKVFNEQFTARNIGDVINISLRDSGIVVGEKNKELDRERKKLESLQEQLGSAREKATEVVASAIANLREITSGSGNVDTIISTTNLLAHACDYTEDTNLVQQRQRLGYSKQESSVSLLSEGSVGLPFRIEEIEAVMNEVVEAPVVDDKLVDLLKTYTSFFTEGSRVYSLEMTGNCPFCRRPWPDSEHMIAEFKGFLESTYSTKRKRVLTYVDQLDQYKKQVATQAKVVNDAFTNVKLEADKYQVDSSTWSDLSLPTDVFDVIIRKIKEKHESMSTVATVATELKQLVNVNHSILKANNHIIEAIRSEVENITTARKRLNSQLAYHVMKREWTKNGKLRTTVGNLVDHITQTQQTIRTLEDAIPPQSLSQKVVNNLLEHMGLAEYSLNHENRLCLRIDKGYDISSEGKRISTAQRKMISLCYFFAELFSEVDDVKKLRDVALIFDDPVDSADYVYFHSITSVIEKCEKILSRIVGINNIKFGQLFVLTHNSILNDRLTSSRWPDCSMQIEKIDSLSTFSSLTKNTNNYLEYIKEVVRFLKSDKPDKRRILFIGNVIRRILEIMASFDNMGSNSFEEILDGMGQSKLAILANHMSHESFTKVMNPFADTGEMKTACVELLRVIKERHPHQYSTINEKFSVESYLE